MLKRSHSLAYWEEEESVNERLGEVHKGNNLERWGMGSLASRFCPGREHKWSGGLIVPHFLKLRLFKWSRGVSWWSSIMECGV